MQAVGLGGSLKFLVVVVAVVAYVLDAMNQIVEMRHLMQERGCQLEDGPAEVFGAEIDFPILLALAFHISLILHQPYAPRPPSGDTVMAGRFSSPS